ncbi:SKP1-like protein 6 [Rosa rugosa]|uniref:SKP1-like protein 6 n=1 Tax=Rosa rugosa TaxID=74645 RepID=UPI002B400B3F|nr:SKP1-like protein 6 [Rosa rugosa]
MSSKKMITLKSLDGRTLEVEEAVAKKSPMIKKMIEDEDVMEDEVDDEDNDNDNVVHLRKVTYKVLDKVMEYCKRHVNDDEKVVNEDELKAWDQDFIVKTDKSTLCNLLLAAYYLNIQSLLLLLSKNAFHKTGEDKTMEDMRILLACQQ